MLKKLFPLILIVLTVLYLTREMGHSKKGAQEAMEISATPVRAVVAKQGTLQEELSFPIDIKATTEVKIIPTYLGRIEKLYAREGAYVNKGDQLLKYVGPQESEDGFFDDLIVKAPISGVVTAVYKEVGSTAEKDNPLFLIVPLDSVKVALNLPSEYQAFVKKGMSSEFKVDAYPDKKYTAVLKNMRPQVEAASRTVYVEYSLTNPNRELLPGMAGTIFIKNSSGVSGVVIPVDSLFVESEQVYAFVNTQGKAQKRKIKVLLEGVSSCVINGNLRAGEQVITTRPDSLKDGDEVVVVQ